VFHSCLSTTQTSVKASVGRDGGAASRKCGLKSFLETPKEIDRSEYLDLSEALVPPSAKILHKHQIAAFLTTELRI
jgi:hypothetical protein